MSGHAQADAGLIVHRRPNSCSVCDDLSYGAQGAERGPKCPTVQIRGTHSKAGSTYGARRHVIPKTRLRSMPRSARKLPGECETVRHAGREPKCRPEGEAEPDSAKRAVGDCSSERPQGSVLPAQQIVGQV